MSYAEARRRLDAVVAYAIGEAYRTGVEQARITAPPACPDAGLLTAFISDAIDGLQPPARPWPGPSP